MGNELIKFNCCPTQQDRLKKDILIYIKRFSTEIWYPSFFNNFFTQSFIQFDQNKYNKAIGGSHYEPTILNEDDYQQKRPFIRFEHYNLAQKQVALKQLIDQSYMVLDQENLSPNMDKIYPDSARKNLFNDLRSSSSSCSVLQMQQDEDIRQKKFSKLKKFDAEVFSCFDKFVNFCFDIREASKEDNNLFSKLFLNFKGDMLGSYKNKSKARQNQSNQKFKTKFLLSTHNFIYCMQECLIKLYNLHIIADKENQNTFFTEVNIHTFITSLIFTDPAFYDLVVKIYKTTYKNKIQSFQRKDFLRKVQIPPQYALDEITINYFNNYNKLSVEQLIQRNVPELFKPTRPADQPYYKCLKMLQKIFEHNEPILKMKVVYQTGLQIQKQINSFYKRNHLQCYQNNLDGGKFLQIVLYIMKKFENEMIVVDVMIINDFIHQYYKSSKKGCFFAPFLIACQGFISLK